MISYYDYDGEPINQREWAILIGDRSGLVRRRVAHTQLDDVEICTVWIGLDLRVRAEIGPPLIFETMVFGGPFDGRQERYATAAQAQIGHEACVAMVELETALAETAEK